MHAAEACVEYMQRVGSFVPPVPDGFTESTSSKEQRREIKNTIWRLVKRFWEEEEQLTFGRRFPTTGLPAYLTKADDSVIRFVSCPEYDDSVPIVALGVLPQHQGSGVGSKLVEKVEAEVRKREKRKLLVSTSNDDLPVLGFCQHLGFQLFEVKPDVIAKKHGVALRGIGDFPSETNLGFGRP